MIIRFSDEEVFGLDSSEYEILQRAAGTVARDGTPGIALEIGTRRGGSAILAMQVMGGGGRPFVCVDPYGNIEIECTNLNITAHVPGEPIDGDPHSKELSKPLRFDYDNSMRNRVIPSLYYCAYQMGYDFRFMCMTDTQYFRTFDAGVPFYDDEEQIVNEYAFVFFDGPHTTDKVLEEVQFFCDRSRVGTVFVVDDIWMYDHEAVEKLMSEYGFETLEKGQVKASYIRLI